MSREAICPCGSEMEETGDGHTFFDEVSVVWECSDCGRTVEKEFHPVTENWTEATKDHGEDIDTSDFKL